MNRGHVHQPGEDPLAEHPMTREQIDALLAEARARTTPLAIRVGHGNRRRWEQWRAVRGRP